LRASQTQQFKATVTGTSNATVTWSLNPFVGTITSVGLYTAPASISSSQSVNVIATSAADSRKTATAVVSLKPTVTVAVSPNSATFRASQTQQFKATVTGTSNSAVTWSLNPVVGTITSAGVYTAPASISSSQNVNIIATSAADTTKTATVAVNLQPTVSVGVSPTGATLAGSQTKQFKATVTGTSNTAVTWSLNPAVGTVSSTGLYTAPGSISSSQNVNIIATSSADSTKTATAIVSLQRPAAPANLVATPASTSSIGLTWSAAASSGLPVQNYHVYRGTTSSNLSQLAIVSQTSYTDSTVTPGTTYYYAVVAADTAGDLSPMSAIVQAIVPSTPSAPSGLLATPVSNTTISLTWPASTSGGLPIQSYLVFRGTTSPALSQVATVAQPAYTDASGSSATTYSYAVQAVDTGGNISPMSATVSVTTLALPAAPTGLLAIPLSPTKISLIWSVPATRSGMPLASYSIYRGRSPSSLTSNYVVASTPTATIDDTAALGTTYYYGIQAKDTGGNVSTMSDVVTVTTPASPTQTPPFQWPASNVYDGVLVNTNQYIVTYLADNSAWFAHVGLAAELAIDPSSGTSTTAEAEALYNQVRSTIEQSSIGVGVYVSGTTVLPQAEENYWPYSSVPLEWMPADAVYSGTWPGNPNWKIIDVTNASTVQALQTGIKALWEEHPASIYMVDNAAANSVVGGTQPWQAQCDNIMGIRTMAEALEAVTIFNVATAPGVMSDSDTDELIQAIGRHNAIMLEDPWDPYVKASPDLTEAAVNTYRQMLDSGIAVIMLPVNVDGEVLAQWINTWRKPADNLYIGWAFFTSPNPAIYGPF
jgi:fibronectin type 3 domain-containing protein